jgi:hypothetical protein
MSLISLLAPFRRAIAAFAKRLAARAAGPPPDRAAAEAPPLPQLSTRIACRREN